MSKPPTVAQTKARERNWHIHQLRMLDAHIRWLSPKRRAAARALIDADLRDMKADTMEEHVNRYWEKYG